MRDFEGKTHRSFAIHPTEWTGLYPPEYPYRVDCYANHRFSHSYMATNYWVAWWAARCWQWFAEKWQHERCRHISHTTPGKQCRGQITYQYFCAKHNASCHKFCPTRDGKKFS